MRLIVERPGNAPPNASRNVPNIIAASRDGGPRRRPFRRIPIPVDFETQHLLDAHGIDESPRKTTPRRPASNDDVARLGVAPDVWLTARERASASVGIGRKPGINRDNICRQFQCTPDKKIVVPPTP